MEDNYAKAYKEVIEILKLVPKESVDKIPKDLINTYNSKMDTNYEFIIDINKSLSEQKLLAETKALLAVIYRDYWATPQEREKILAKEKTESDLLEKAKMEKYNYNDMFANRNKTEKDQAGEEKDKNANLPMEVKKENFFQKLVNFIKGIFNK